MSQEEYDTKLRNVHRFIPFLENMIVQLKDLKKKNREQQVTKMESLYQMITDKNKKLKLETLQKCEEVIVKLYYKVKGENAPLPYTSSTDTTRRKEEKRKPINLYSIAGETINNKHSPFKDEYGTSTGCSGSKSPRQTNLSLRKPPISYSDLECLQQDVVHELEKKMSLNELNSLKSRLCKELAESESDQINTTVRNKPVPMRVNASSPDKNKKKIENVAPQIKGNNKIDATDLNKIDPKSSVPKVLKEADDIFGNAFSEIDKTYETEAKKKEEKKICKEIKDDRNADLLEKTSLKKLSERAVEFRKSHEMKEKVSKQTSLEKSNSKADVTGDDNNGKTEFNALPDTSHTKTDEVNTKNNDIKTENEKEKTECQSGNSSEKKSEEISEIEDLKVVKVKDKSVSEQVPSKTFSDQTNAKEKHKNEKTHSNHSSRDKKYEENRKDKFDKNHKSEHKKDKNDRSHKSDHKKDKDDKRKEKSQEKEKKEQSKDKNTKGDKFNKPINDKQKQSINEEKKDGVLEDEPVKVKKDDELKKSVVSPKALDVLGKIHSQIDIIKGKAVDSNIDEVSKKISEMVNEETKIPEKTVPPILTVEKQTENKVLSRDPRLKSGRILVGATVSKPTLSDPKERLAFKYNPKPKKQETAIDLDKNVLESIEMSMKESNIPLLPPLLAPPPPPPNDLFSPESPDEMHKAAVPPLINDLLLNPKTTGMINDVVSALRRTNNDKNFISKDTTIINNDIGQPLYKQSTIINFSPPATKLQFDPPPATQLQFDPPPKVDRSTFVPQQYMDNQTRSFSQYPSNEPNDFERTNFHLSRNHSMYEPTNTHVNHCEDRMDQSYFMERSGQYIPPSPSYVTPSNFIPPSPSYGAPSNYIPPSPSYVPPSSLYDGNSDSFRERNYQNFQTTNHQRFNSDIGLVHPASLGEPRPGLSYNRPYNQSKYDSFNRFSQRGNNHNIGQRSNFYAGNSRDPRISMNRGVPQYSAQEPRPMAQESRMTYREYKEQKERETRERDRREREIRQKEEAIEKEKNAKDETEQNALTKESEVVEEQRETENPKTSEDLEERKNDRLRSDGRSRTRDRSRDRFSKNRSSSRYRRDRDDYRSRDKRNRDEKDDRSRDRSRNSASKFDKAYSVRGKDKDSSSLNNLFPSKSAEGKGNNYKIPKKVREQPKDDVKSNDDSVGNVKPIQSSDNVDKNKDVSISKREDDSIKLKKPTSKNSGDNEVKKEIEVNKCPEKKTESENEAKEQVIEDKIEEVNEKINKLEENNDENSQTEVKSDENSKTSEQSDSRSNERKEEENILSKFFQNLMKSSNKDEKKGALLSLISTFSDSFSNQQLQKITNIIRSEDGAEESNIEDKKIKKEENQSTSIEKTEDKIENQSESALDEGNQEKIVDEIETPSEEVLDDKTNQSDEKEKIETQDKIETPKETKLKMKTKTELDRLHDDIREMFIRDGVVTATGKRMCRILKDTSSSPSTENEKPDDEENLEEKEKKIQLPKKRGRKPGYRKNLETPELGIKELTVVLPKMSLEVIKKKEETLEGEEFEKENVPNDDKQEENQLEHPNEENLSDKEIVEKSSPVKKGRPRKRSSWATGIIKKKSGPKSRKLKVTEQSEMSDKKTVIESEPETELKKDTPIENLHEIDYCLKIGEKNLQCKFCEVATKWIAAHYRTEHPNEEVLSSRLPQYVAKVVIADAIKNKEMYEKDVEESMVKHEFNCCFCDYKQLTVPRMYRDHVSIHTGEFRHTCPYCSYSRSHIKTMQCHLSEVHAEEEAVSKRPIISERAPNNRNTYAFLCELCYFTQMSFDNVKKHVKTYHSGTKQCNIYKIKVNQTEKIEEEDIKPQSERTTRRSAKFTSNLDMKSLDCSDKDKNPDGEETLPTLQKEETPKKKDGSEIIETDIDDDSIIETEKPTTSSKKRKQRKRRDEPISASPSPVRKRLKRQCTLKNKLKDEVDEDSEDNEDKAVKNIDEAVFTSNTDIQEDNKKIEEERLKTMQDINSSIKLRTSLDFVEKLSHRLKQEEVIIKQEIDEPVENVLESVQASDLPVFEKSAIQNRDSEAVHIRQEGNNKVAKESGKMNPINGVIEKLQGVLGCDYVASPIVSNDESSLPSVELNNYSTCSEEEAPKRQSVDNYKQPPPLIHMDNVDQTIASNKLINSETLNIGSVKIMKTELAYIYVCCIPPCIYSSRDRSAFTNHCEFSHQWNESSPTSTECADCGVTITSSERSNILLSALNHAINDHSDFLGVKVGSIRISSNLFPDVQKTPPTISIPSPEDHQVDDVDYMMKVEPLVVNEETDNPFSFKIVDVVSLADENLEPLNTSDHNVEAQTSEKEPGPSQIEQNATTTQNIGKCTASRTVLKSWPKSDPKKSEMAMKKFLCNHFDLYKCPDFYCLFTTKKRKMFDIHLKMHPNNNVPMNCIYCDKLIDFEMTGEHYEKLHGMCRFSCAYCLYRCLAKDYMDIHQLIAHSSMPSRMQLLPKRDSEEKNPISILSEMKKNNVSKSYACCHYEFKHQMQFIDHVENCPNNIHFMCFHLNGNKKICRKTFKSAKDLANHWGTHGVHPLECAYCNVGSSDLNTMMIHLVVEHPTLPPDIIDRYTEPASYNKRPFSSVHCNFKQLLSSLKASFKVDKMAKETAPVESIPVVPPAAPTINTPPPPTMQKAFEHFVRKKIAMPYSKPTPVNLIQQSPPSLALLTPASNSAVLNAGGLLYCLASAPNSPKSVLKAIVVNKDAKVSPQKKLQLVKSPPTSSDPTFQIVMPVTSKMPTVAPLTQKVAPMAEIPQTEGVIVNVDLSEDSVQKDACNSEDVGEMDSLEEPMVILNDDLAGTDGQEAVDPLSLESEDPLNIQPSKSPNPAPAQEYDSDSKDVDQQEVVMQKTGLEGYQLYRCAKCEMFFSGCEQFKEHLIKFTQCKFESSPQRPYKCYHCKKYLKFYTNLLDHLGYHGIPKYTCSLCNKKFSHANQVKYHMKSQHNIVNVQMHSNNDCFIAKPQVIGGVKQAVKEPSNEIDTQKSTELKTMYYSFEADQIPQKSILGYDITCGHCKKFKNKVRSNIIRHLLLHQNDKDFDVPDTAPVNPVPCLEKNEKMFDKMYNLASSSHTGGRMGGQQKGEISKDKVKDTNHPAFVPTNKRYQCCAVGCNYLCLEEGNLRHHLTALHMEDLNFVCVHCKKDLSDAVDVDTIIKHLKLHDLHLYKCSSCDYMHNLKHKIERHIGEDHKNKESKVVVIRAMDAEPYDEKNMPQQQQPSIPIINQKSHKSWRCCMCKYKCHTEEEVMNHVKNKHNIDCRYKCALCTFKTDDVSEFTGHFTEDHPDNEVDIISVYQKKDDENNITVPESEQFDTTPLWSRDKPRVRHIRGILFEEDTTAKKKPITVKSTDQNPKELNSSTSLKKRKRSMSMFNELHKSEDDELEPKKEAMEKVVENSPKNNDVIVIDDEEEPKTDDKSVKSTENEELGDIDLICKYGDFGMPLNKQFKCPKCEKYKTSKMRDFVQHMAGELRYHRFMCTICQEKFITLENIQMHCIDYHDCSVKSVANVPVNEEMNKWLTLLLTEQRKIIKNLGFSCDDIPDQIEDFLGSLELSSNKSIKCKECNFSVSGPQALDRHMKYNHPHIAFARSSSTPDRARPRSLSVSDKKRKNEEHVENQPEMKKLKVATTSKTNFLAKDKYVCKMCGVEFNSVPEMEYHGKEVHNGVVDYSVKTTDLSISPGILRNHYRCRFCATTGTKAHLENHIHMDHPGQNLEIFKFACGVCSAKFEQLKSFKQHFKSHDLPEIYYYDIYDRKKTLNITSSLSPKYKWYKCPVCPYSGQSINTANIKHHLKLHAKPYQCDLCQNLFKTRPDARVHHVREHATKPESISLRQDMVEKFNELVEKVITTAVEEVENDKPIAYEIEETNITIQPEVLLNVEENEMVDVESMSRDESSSAHSKGKRYFARKSTGSKRKRDESLDYYSFYGQKAEVVDMKKIITNFEIADAQMKMSCDQLSKIYNLNPILKLKDCMTLIINDEDEVSS